MFIMAADHTEVTRNQIFGNDSQGLTMISYLTSQVSSRKKPALDIEPNADNNFVHDNLYRDNGLHPAKTYLDQKIPGGDLMWDGTGVGNGWSEQPGLKTVPPELPSRSGFQPTDLPPEESR